MTEENLNVNQGVPTMMGLDSGPDVETMNSEAAAAEYNGMMKDPKFMGSEYEDNITHSKRVERSQKLFKLGFAEKIAGEKRLKSGRPRKCLRRNLEKSKKGMSQKPLLKPGKLT